MLNSLQEKVLFNLTGKLQLDQLSLEDLEKMIAKAPYFGPLHLLYARLLSTHNQAEQFNQASKKALLFGNNPFWIQFQLFPIAEQVTNFSNTNQIVPSVEQVKEVMRTLNPAPSLAENRIANLLGDSLAAFKKPIDKEDQLDIDNPNEKLHTIDYFASQGIKIDLTNIPKDKLTTHLLSFTDWLKQLKQNNGLPPELANSLDKEKEIAETALKSNKIDEIITESMASVLVKQGQKEKAIQVYSKLSFLNPEKSSYFAAKIEQLKGK